MEVFDRRCNFAKSYFDFGIPDVTYADGYVGFHKINGVINMTCRPSFVKMDVSINAEHSFVQVEEELYLFFERITGKYPQIKGKCTYMGVQDCKATFNVYRIAIPCEEIDRVPLRRALTKEFSEFCKERNISRT